MLPRSNSTPCGSYPTLKTSIATWNKRTPTYLCCRPWCSPWFLSSEGSLDCMTKPQTRGDRKPPIYAYKPPKKHHATSKAKTSNHSKRYAGAGMTSNAGSTVTQQTPQSTGNGLPCVCTLCSHRYEAIGPQWPSLIALRSHCQVTTIWCSHRTRHSFWFSTTRCHTGEVEPTFPSLMSSTPCCWHPSAHFLDPWSFHVPIRHPETRYDCRTPQTSTYPRWTCPNCWVKPWHHHRTTHHGHVQYKDSEKHIQPSSCHQTHPIIQWSKWQTPKDIQWRPCCVSTTLYHHSLALMKMATLSVLLSSRGLHPPYSKLAFVVLTLLSWHVAKNVTEMNPLHGPSTAVTQNCRQVQNRAWPSFRIHTHQEPHKSGFYRTKKIALVCSMNVISWIENPMRSVLPKKFPKFSFNFDWGSSEPTFQNLSWGDISYTFFQCSWIIHKLITTHRSARRLN